LFLTNNNYEERGIGLNSPLNIFRFIFLTIPPILIFYTNKKENKLNFNFYFNKFYLIFLFGLALFYNLGYTEYYIQMEDNYLFRPQDNDFYDISTIKTKLSNTIPKQDWGMIWCK
jgi:hypothetical protein